MHLDKIRELQLVASLIRSQVEVIDAMNTHFLSNCNLLYESLYTPPREWHVFPFSRNSRGSTCVHWLIIHLIYSKFNWCKDGACITRDLYSAVPRGKEKKVTASDPLPCCSDVHLEFM